MPLIERLASERGAAVSVDTYKPAVAEAAIAAGAVLVNDVSGLRDPALADVCARTGAGLVLMHTRVEPKGTLLDPAHYEDVAADVAAFLRERMELALEHAAWRPSRSCSTPGRTSPRRRRRRSRCCARSAAARARPPAAAGGLQQGLRRRDHRAPPRERLAGTLAAVAHGVDAGAAVLRVHDVAAAADFLACAPCCAARSSSHRTKVSPRIATLRERKGSPVAAHNAAGRRPTTDLQGS